MRGLLVVAGGVVLGIVLLAVAVVVIGWLLPRRHLASRSAPYRATPERLYALIAGPQDWRPDVLRSEPVADAGGRELMRETTRNGEAITDELLDRTPPEFIERRIASEDLPYSGTWTYSLRSNQGVTFVRITEQGEVQNPVYRFVSRFILGHTRAVDGYLRALGKAVGQEVRITD